ncbi:MAG: 30S ribosome-binding factor RbfA [Clostridia bacterium]|nr:30S ribosome-binding factor RbfA [Clostridia bacterium]
MRENRRLIKINEEIKKELNLIISFKLKNPNINGLITATKVSTTPDLKYCTVYISMMNKSDNQKKEILDAFKKSKGFIKSEIARSINLRITPEFIFKEDDSLAYAEHMDEIFRKIHENENHNNDEEIVEEQDEDIEENDDEE